MTAQIETQFTRKPVANPLGHCETFMMNNADLTTRRDQGNGGQLWERVAERSRMRNPGGIVYVYGRSIATVIHPDNDGAVVREHDDNGETWFPWSDLAGERIK